MKESTRNCIAFLCSPSGKKAYKQALNEELRTTSKNEVIYDRAPYYALQTVFERFAPGMAINGDDALTAWWYETKELNDYGETVCWSKLPGIISRCKKFDTMAEKIGWLLDEAQPE